MSFLNDLKRAPLLKDMPSEIKVVKEDLLAIKKDHRRLYAQYTAASQTGPYIAHMEGEYARPLYTLRGSQASSQEGTILGRSRIQLQTRRRHNFSPYYIA